MRSCLSCLAMLLLAAAPVLAIDLVTSARVEIVEGIALSQTTALNFGVLARNNGTVTVAAADGAITDPTNLMVDATNVSQGIFMVNSMTGADLEVDCTGGVMPSGITMGAFTADWANSGTGGAVPVNRTLLTDDEVLEIGATITVDRTTVALTGGTPATLPYTVSVTYQ
ncbi:MAG: hypothetical protein R3D98_17020 [Candidatus Krumholzibacteriia bacterium]